MSSVYPAFELTKITHQFRSESGATLEVLRDVHLRVERGQSVAILGPSGSGKSTLLSIIAGLQRPTSGAVQWNGREITHLPERELSSLRASSVALVFQQFLLIPHLTALENVSLPLELQGTKRAPARQLAMRLLTEYGLQDRANHFPRMLSGGECQRVAIARAVIVEPTLLLADEPTGNLDPISAKSVFERLLDLPKQGKVGALVLVTHNEELAQFCDVQFRLNFGDLRMLQPEAHR
ncbi:ABC transporter ATP-binding protein [bacterium]|nr:ABC transporter ATP-binding protein [bacterium]